MFALLGTLLGEGRLLMIKCYSSRILNPMPFRSSFSRFYLRSEGLWGGSLARIHQLRVVVAVVVGLEIEVVKTKASMSKKSTCY
jgi:hypothetical protein